MNTIWQVISDFDHLTSGNATCTVCGSIKADTYTAVFRPPQIIDEFTGFADICQSCMEQGANELGWIDPVVAKALIGKQAVDAESIRLLEEKLKSSREALATVTRENVGFRTNSTSEKSLSASTT